MTVNTTSCYMWHESTGNRGANDVASCLHGFLKALPNSVEHVTVYSDNCSGQNKNKMSAGMFTTDVHDKPLSKMIDHKFLIVGHTLMECDKDWYNLVRYAGKSKIFDVHVMKQDDFYDFASLFKNILVNRKQDTDGNIFSWNEERWLRYTKKFGEVMYKNSLSEKEPFKKISFLRKFEPGIVHVIDGVPKTYTPPLGISREKKKDLESILHLLSPENKKFYLDLPIDEKQNNTDREIPSTKSYPRDIMLQELLYKANCPS
ncbi:hypothetical protein QAD02_008912 [Eretmocerus hayati]|uniref:Uncharacterized protein n=1 Tax=Eretmocerus hayati TaxID=131215 RepID=A0ACC2N7T5_9HYME|nr:hypothetical protein QAD02_008912 [Eretmocerus hayati]